LEKYQGGDYSESITVINGFTTSMKSYNTGLMIKRTKFFMFHPLLPATITINLDFITLLIKNFKKIIDSHDLEIHFPGSFPENREIFLCIEEERKNCRIAKIKNPSYEKIELNYKNRFTVPRNLKFWLYYLPSDCHITN